jgi:hypothetical protein
MVYIAGVRLWDERVRTERPTIAGRLSFAIAQDVLKFVKTFFDLPANLS